MNKIESEIIENIESIIQAQFNHKCEPKTVMIEIPKDNNNGDYSTNIAMRLAKILRKKPQEIAQTIVSSLENFLSCADKIEIAGPGFINFFVKKDLLASCINNIIDQGKDYGKNNVGQNLSVLVEYVSANPTGILHLGHARGAVWGDCICRLYQKSGYNCLREYYINDAGNQINMLAESVYVRYKELFGYDGEIPKDGYAGSDIKQIAQIIKDQYGDQFLDKNDDETKQFFKNEAKRLELQRIEEDLKFFKCEFDTWISEQDILNQGRVESALAKMTEMGLVYEADDAIWFKSTNYGDDKDRVLKKSDGFYTYLTPDIAYHMYKFERGYTKLIDLWGADHHGYIPRMKAAIKALGHDDNALEVDIIQMVRLVENGLEVKMSKRSGNAITIRELCEDIGVDAARYFFVSKAVDVHFDFDLGLARSKTNDNPVFYAQYAYARICSVLKKFDGKVEKLAKYDLLVSEKEIDLIKHLNEFVSVVKDAAVTRMPNKICNYIQKLAAYFHSFYNQCKVIDYNNQELTLQRLALLKATQITLGNAFDLIGISALENM